MSSAKKCPFTPLLKDFVPIVFLALVSLACLAAMLIAEKSIVINPEHVTTEAIDAMVEGLKQYFWVLGSILLFVALGYMSLGKEEDEEDTVTVLASVEKKD